MNQSVDFSELAVGGWIGFPMCCLSGYLFLWDQYLPAPLAETPKKRPEAVIRQALKKQRAKK